nr:hypothetical protein BaRGS_024066 [Batillaria attramentaria]
MIYYYYYYSNLLELWAPHNSRVALRTYTLEEEGRRTFEKCLQTLQKELQESVMAQDKEMVQDMMNKFLAGVGPVIFQGLGPGRGNGITAQRYMDQVLHPHVLPFFQAHGNWVKQCVNQ